MDGMHVAARRAPWTATPPAVARGPAALVRPMPRVAAFEVESDLRRNPFPSASPLFDTPEEARLRLRGGRCRFDGGAVRDLSTGEMREFGRRMAADLAAHLARFDELAGLGTRTRGLIVLESALGRDAVAPLWSKVHHDLKGWRGFDRLDVMAEGVLGIRKHGFDAEGARLYRERLADKAYPHPEDADRIANCVRDVDMVGRLFERYRREGETRCTHRPRTHRPRMQGR